MLYVLYLLISCLCLCKYIDMGLCVDRAGSCTMERINLCPPATLHPRRYHEGLRRGRRWSEDIKDIMPIAYSY